MGRKQEFSNKNFRERSFSDAEVRGTSRFNADEVRTILSGPAGGKKMCDLRQIGCPDALFERALEQRAKKLGIMPKQDDDLEVRIAATKPF